MAISGEHVTFWMALIGLFFSVALGAIRVTEFLQNRARVLIREDAPSYLDPLGLRFAVTVINKGRRPITIEGCAIVTRDGELYRFGEMDKPVVQTDLPKTLAESERAQMSIDLRTLRDFMTKWGHWPPKRVVFYDSAGKRYGKKLVSRVSYVTDDEVAACEAGEGTAGNCPE